MKMKIKNMFLIIGISILVYTIATIISLFRLRSQFYMDEEDAIGDYPRSLNNKYRGDN